MFFDNQFRDFDPLVDVISDFPFNTLSSYGEQARSLLSARKPSEVIAAVKASDWMVDQAFADEVTQGIEAVNSVSTAAERERLKDIVFRKLHTIHQYPDDLLKWDESGKLHFSGDDEDLWPDILGDDSRLDLLKRCVSQYIPIEDPPLPNGTAAEYFAAVALAIIAKVPALMGPYTATHWQYERSKNNDPDFAKTLAPFVEKVPADPLHAEVTIDRAGATLFASSFALLAVEAVCWAKHLIEIDSIERNAEARANLTAKETLSAQNSAAARKRHERHHQIKQEARTWYSTNRQRFKSMDAAAEAAQYHFGMAFRTLRRWISEFSKELPSARSV